MRAGSLLSLYCLLDFSGGEAVQPNKHWFDEDGHRIEAHGAGFLQNPIDRRWYWYGESKKVRTPNDEGGVNCYSSASLKGPWRFEGEVFGQADVKMDGWPGPWVIERPKVLYNKRTQKFVMWFHLDLAAAWLPDDVETDRILRRIAPRDWPLDSAYDAAEGTKETGRILRRSAMPDLSWDSAFDAAEGTKALRGAADATPRSLAVLESLRLATGKYVFKRAAVATSDSPAGPFRFQGALLPDGRESTDMNLFQDPLDHKAYFLRHCGHHQVCISGLTDDYLNTTGVATVLPQSVEGVAMFRLANGTYYVLSSHLTGWNPNPMIAWRSRGTTLQDAEWDDIGNPTQDEYSFNSQPTYVVQYQPPEGDPYFVYMGDNWIRCGRPSPEGKPGMLPNACYTWLPIEIDGPRGPLSIRYSGDWDMDKPVSIRYSRMPHPWLNYSASRSGLTRH